MVSLSKTDKLIIFFWVILLIVIYLLFNFLYYGTPIKILTGRKKTNNASIKLTPTPTPPLEKTVYENYYSPDGSYAAGLTVAPNNKQYKISINFVAPDITRWGGSPSQRWETAIAKNEHAFAFAPKNNLAALYIPGKIVLFELITASDTKTASISGEKTEVEVKIDNIKDISVENLPGEYIKNARISPKAIINLSFSGDNNQIFFHYYPNGYIDSEPRQFILDVRTKQQVMYDLTLYPPDEQEPFYPLPGREGFAYWMKNNDTPSFLSVVLFKNKQFTKIATHLSIDYPGGIYFSPDLETICLNKGASGTNEFAVINRNQVLYQGDNGSSCIKWINNNEVILDDTGKIVLNITNGKQYFLAP